MPMRQNPNYLLRTVAGSLVLVPVGEATKDFPGMITMNPTGAYLWEQLAKPCTEEELVNALLDRYDVTADQARADTAAFLEPLKVIGAVVE